MKNIEWLKPSKAGLWAFICGVFGIALVSSAVLITIASQSENSVIRTIAILLAIGTVIGGGFAVANWFNVHDGKLNVIGNDLIEYFTWSYCNKYPDICDRLKFALKFNSNVVFLNFTLTTLYNGIPVEVFESGNILSMKKAEALLNELKAKDLVKHEVICYNKYLEKVIDKNL